MIYSNIAEYEPGDSMLARQTILDLHKEIERLIKNNIALEEEIDDLRKLEATLTIENEKLNNIIEEIREYIESKKYWFCDDYDLREEDGKNILEILDKEK